MYASRPIPASTRGPEQRCVRRQTSPMTRCTARSCSRPQRSKAIGNAPSRTTERTCSGCRAAYLDPKVVSALLSDPKEADRLGSLSPRERSVLELVAEGRSNKAIGERLAIPRGAVQKHVSTIFNKLDLPAGEDDDRRILAVLAFVLAGPHAQSNH
jgi:DNA-binding NarL/FixJ family response regulator